MKYRVPFAIRWLMLASCFCASPCGLWALTAALPRTNSATPLSDEAGIKHWAFQPLQAMAVPVIHGEDWPKTPIDSFILAKLTQNQLRPSPKADKRTLIRRATFDLIGLPPTPQEIASFLGDDS